MKKFIFYAAAVSALIAYSCEEDFNPKADFVQKYVLWSVVNSSFTYDTTFQNVVITKMYDVEGLDPYANRIDPVITGADVRMYVDNFEYLFTQDTMKRRDTTRYDSTFIYYRSPAMKLNYGSKLRILAKLPNGQVLSSETSLPLNEGLEFSPDFVTGVSTLRRTYGDTWEIRWNSEPNHIFFPKLILSYTKKEGEEYIDKSVQVPLQYVDNKPFYLDYTYEEGVTYQYDAIDSAMAMISKGDSIKSNYHITGFSFQLLEFDAPLSQYYSSIHGYLDNYSIRLDESVYSNISGGIGIFGSTYSVGMRFPVAEKYAQKFGYR